MQGRYWLGTLYNWTPPDALPDSCTWIKGQKEICPTTSREHYQVIAGFKRAVRLAAVKRAVGNGHWELTRSDAADAYVWKEQTSVEGSRFELGAKAIRRNVAGDWQKIKADAQRGALEEIPADIYIRYYRTLKVSLTLTPGHCF